MVEQVKRGILWVAKPSPERLMAGLLVVGIVAITAMVVSILALKSSVEAAAEREASEKFQVALCEVWAFNLPRPGDPPRATESGRVQLARAREQYNRSGCEKVLQDAGRIPR